MALDIVEQAALSSALLIVASGLAVSQLRKRLAARKALDAGDTLRLENVRRVERTAEERTRQRRRGARARLLIGRSAMTLRARRRAAGEQIAYANVRVVSLRRIRRRAALLVECVDGDAAWEWTVTAPDGERLLNWFTHVGIRTQRLQDHPEGSHDE